MDKRKETEPSASAVYKGFISGSLAMPNRVCSITDSNSKLQMAENVGEGVSEIVVHKILSIYMPYPASCCFQHVQHTTVAEAFALTTDYRTRKPFLLRALSAYREFGLCLLLQVKLLSDPY
jgi:hypothetical protein